MMIYILLGIYAISFQNFTYIIHSWPWALFGPDWTLTLSFLLCPKLSWLFWFYPSKQIIFCKIFNWVMLSITQPTTLLEILFESSFDFKVIFKSLSVTDDNCPGNLKAWTGEAGEQSKNAWVICMTEPATKHESDSHHLEHDLSLTQSFLRVTLEIVFWIFHT